MKNDIQGIIFDIDGVLEFRGVPYLGAVETIHAARQKGLRICYLTNSTLKSRQSAAQKLAALGFEIEASQVITASSATAAYLRRLQPRSCWVMLEREGLDEFKEFPQDEDNPEYLVVGDNRSRFNFDTLNKAFRLLLKGTKLIAMQAELMDTSKGEPELNVGSYALMLERASGIKAVTIGKPGAYAFQLALEMLDLPKEAVVIVGDRIQTDIRGAKDFGIRSILLKTGEFDPRELKPGLEPDWMLESMEELLRLVKRDFRG